MYHTVESKLRTQRIYASIHLASLAAKTYYRRAWQSIQITSEYHGYRSYKMEEQSVSSTHKSVILEVGGTNYRKWHKSLIDLLSIQGLYSYVLTNAMGLPMKDAPEDKDELEKYLVNRRKVIGYINRTLGENDDVVDGEEDPINALATIKSLYSSTSQYDKATLLDRFINLKPSGDDFQSYMTELKAVQNGLKDNKVVKSDDEMVLQMMTRLKEYPEGHAYREGYQILRTQELVDGSVPLPTFQRVVLSSFRQLKNAEVEEAKLEKAFQAMAVQRGYEKKGSKSDSSTEGAVQGGGYKGRCRYCMEQGHSIYRCMKKPPGSCNFCGGDHLYHDCDHSAFKQNNHSQGGGRPKKKTAGEADTEVKASAHAVMKSIELYSYSSGAKVRGHPQFYSQQAVFYMLAIHV